MSRRVVLGVWALVLGFCIGAPSLRAEENAKPQAADARHLQGFPPIQVLASILNRWEEVVQPPAGQPPQTLVTRLKVVRAQGVPSAVSGLVADVAFQAPDRLRVSAVVGRHTYTAG